MILLIILMILVSLIGFCYFKKTVDLTTAIIYEFYALMIILIWSLFVLIIQ